MMWVECSVIDLKTNKIKGKYHKTFNNIGEFTPWYRIVKTDCDTIINIMRFDYNNKPGLKHVNDAKLLRVSRLVST
jgi:hypothetical protein